MQTKTLPNIDGITKFIKFNMDEVVKFHRLGLRKSVILGLIIWLVVVVLASGFAFYVSSEQKEALGTVSDNLHNQYNNTLQIYESAIDIQLKINDLDQRINVTLKTGQDTSSYIAEDIESIDQSLQSLNNYAGKIGSDRIGLISSRLNKAMASYKEQLQTIIKIVTTKGQAIPAATMDQYYQDSDAVNAFAASLSGLSKTVLDGATEELVTTVSKAEEASSKNLLITGGFNLLFLTMMIFVSIVVFKWVIDPIILTTKNINQVATGDLSPPKKLKSYFSEIQQVHGALARLINTSRQAQILNENQIAEDERKQRRAMKIEENIEIFYTSMSELLTSLNQSASNLRSAAEQTLSVADVTKEQVIHATSSADHARSQLASVANSTTELDASIGDIVMQISRASTISEDARLATRRADDTMLALQDAVQRIGEVVKFIREIAEQTNLLALNATIESARAGTAGVGFAVVAREVKQLSSQTTEATTIISSHIQGVEQATMDAISAVQSLRDMINEVNSLSASVATAVTQQRHATSIIAENVETVSNQASDISSKMLTVSNSSEGTTRTAADLLAAAEQLSHQAKNIERDVKDFLDGIRNA
ncbi:MAG: methyl-accepting chemotaxis protein [Alphaproteobacteria bacterium]|nr:methyl-accepting chemotaxis protein [Alphaproteobacteria bacterium]